MKAIPIAALFLIGYVVAACGQTAPAPTQQNRVIEKWLSCEECSNGELQALVQIGQPAVGPLATALRNGPPQTLRDERRRQLSAKYRASVEYARTHPDSPVPMSEDQYIRRHMDNLVLLYQIRAATGLGFVGGPDARRELTQALSLPLPPDVLVAIRQALVRIG